MDCYKGLNIQRSISQLLEEKAKMHKLNILYVLIRVHLLCKLLKLLVSKVMKLDFSLTPIMCGTTIHLAGGTPIYVDVNQDFLIDEKDVLKKLQKIPAILAVHMYSGICNLRI